MKNPKSTIILTIILSLLFFYLGLLFQELFYNSAIIPNVEGVKYNVTELGGMKVLLFSLVYGLMPLLILLTWKLTPIVTVIKKTLTVFIILISILCAVLIGHLMIKSHLKGLTEIIDNKVSNVHIDFPFEHLYFEYYMLGGLCLGCILSYFLFKKKTINENASR